MPRASKPTNTENPSAAQVLAEHYQKTSELTYALRDQRDKIFIFLLIALAAATLFNFDATSSDSLLVAGIVKFLQITDAKIITGLQTSPLLEIVQTLLLAAVFYLMSNLYQRTASMLRNFLYLGAMEQEIRDRLGIEDAEASFSREGGYYWRLRKEDPNSHDGVLSRLTRRIRALDLTKNFYTIFLALLLLLSFVLRIMSDAGTQNWILVAVDSLIGIPTLVYWWNYARVSRDLDKAAPKKR